MKKIILFFALFMATSLSYADNLSDSNKLFDCAEQTFPELFDPAGEETFKLDEYWVRYYSNTENYVGTSGADAYVYGDIFNGLLYVGQVDDLIETICPAMETSLAGSWIITGEVDARSCGEGVQSINYTATVTTDGDQVTFTAGGVTREGELDEDKIRYTVSYSEDGGTTNETGTITVNNETSIKGVQDWRWSNGQFSCSGKSTFSGSKI